jgi:hypothetical protein
VAHLMQQVLKDVNRAARVMERKGQKQVHQQKNKKYTLLYKG